MKSKQRAKGKPAGGASCSNKKASEFIQDYLPFENIRDGIIQTTDKRYIKILEIEPINFMLRSYDEQMEIIGSFASWLKISPVKLQFKTISRRADSDRHIRHIAPILDAEQNEQCMELGKEYVRLIKDVGNREALTRRFFLIFEYEPFLSNHEGSYAEVVSTLQSAVQNAKSYFGLCGNGIIQHENEDEQIAEILYSIFNRKSCVDEPLRSRIDRVATDTMIARGLTVGVDDVPYIPLNQFIAPRGMDFRHRNYVVMDGMYYSYLYIMNNGYPTTVRPGWMAALTNAGEGIDIDLHFQRENRGRSMDKVSQRIRLNRVKLKNMQDTSTDYEEVANSITAGYYIKNGLANNNEDLFYMHTFITISAYEYRDLIWRKRHMVDMLKSMDIQVSECGFMQEAAFQSTMPLLRVDPRLEKQSRRNVLTSGAASTYMYTGYELSDEDGILMGVNTHNNSLCMLDLFDSTKYKNANVSILGTSGAGKTFCLQLVAMRFRLLGIQSFIIAPIKGHEFFRACMKIGGEFISISPGSKHRINIMEVRPTVSPAMELIDGVDYNATDSLLARKIQQLIVFFSLLIPDLTNEEEQLLDECIIKTYEQFGITYDNDSIYRDDGSIKNMPILGDLHKHIKEVEMLERVEIILRRLVTGSAQFFNGQTNVNTDNKYVVLDFSSLKGRLLPLGVFVATDLVWDLVKADRTQRKAIILDEIWQLIGGRSDRTGSANRQAAEFVLEIFKIIRGYGGAAINATQDISDYFSLDDGRYGRAILNNSKTKIVLNLEPDEAKIVQQNLDLTNSEVKSIIQFERGQALLSSNSNKISVNIRASDVEKNMITTDRRDLEAIATREQESEHNAYKGPNTHYGLNTHYEGSDENAAE